MWSAREDREQPNFVSTCARACSHLEHVGDVQALCGDVQQLVCHACVDALQRLHLARIQFQADLRSHSKRS